MKLPWHKKTKEKGISEAQAFGDKIGTYLRDFNIADKEQLLTGFVYDCIDLIGDRIASLPIEYKRKGEVIDWQVFNILNQETPIGFFPDKIKYAVMSYLTEGKAVFYAPKVGNTISGFYNIPSSYVMVEREASINGFMERPQSYLVRIQSYQYRIPAEDMIVIRNPSIFGLAPDQSFIDAYKYTIKVNFDIDRYLIKTFGQNNMSKSVVLTTEQSLNEKEAERIRLQWKRNYSSFSDTGDVAVLGKGLHIDKFSMSPKEVGYLASKKLIVLHILGMFRVPASILGMTEGINRANAEANEYTFSKYAIEPIARKFANVFSARFGKPPVEVITFANVVQRNIEFEHQAAVDMVKLNAVNLNYIRQLHGLPADPKFDKTLAEFMQEFGGNDENTI